MALVDWNDKLSVGVRELDAQHRQLVDMINDLHLAMRDGKSKTAVGGLVGKLKEYARVHFAAEEKHMRRLAYPDLAKHSTSHNQFIEKVLDYELEIQGGNGVSGTAMMVFLKDWLVRHIQGEDKGYGPYFNDKGLR